MSGIRKIIAGLIKPQEYLQKTQNEENIQNFVPNSGTNKSAQNIGEQLGGVAQKLNINIQQNNLPDNPANRIIAQQSPSQQINESVNIKPSDIAANTVQNIEKQNAVIQNQPHQTKLDQILADDNVSKMTTNSTVQNTTAQTAQPQNNPLNADIVNSTTQNIVNNEKMSQAVSYQVNNNATKDTVKDVDQRQAAINRVDNNNANVPKERPVINAESQGGKPSVGNGIPNIAPDSMQTKVNNTNQTTYNQQYKAVIDDANKKPYEEIKNNIKENKPILQNSITPNNRTDQMQRGIERSILVKNMLGLPKTFGEMLFAAQDKNSPINTNTLLLNNLNQNMLQNQKILAQIFDDTSEVQPNINVVNNVPIQQNIPIAPENDAITLIFSGMIRMPEISALILKNSKNAVSQLTAAMASAVKSSVSESIKETLNVINSCIAMADSGNSAQTLKSLMMLYIPWLPLNEGVGFDMEIETPGGEIESNASKLTVLIQTRNFGNVKGVFTLTTTNSVDAYIICNDSFPKKTLLTSLNRESEAHSMSTNIDIESVTPIKSEENNSQEAKVNLSATNEMNPYLLLMAHSFIRNTIAIDSEAEFAMAANSPS